MSCEDSNLTGVDLARAKLRRVSFKNTDLTGANFSGVMLDHIGALPDFDGADLTDVDLSGLDLAGVDLDSAILCRTKLPWGEENSGCSAGEETSEEGGSPEDNFEILKDTGSCVGCNLSGLRIDGFQMSESGDLTRGPVYAYLSIKEVFQVDGLQFTLREFKTNAPGARFAARSQETILKLAWGLLESKKNLDTFIYENISDKNIRRQRNDRLRAYSTPFADVSVKIIEGSPAKLFKRMAK